MKTEQNLINKISDILQLYPDLFDVASILNEYRKEPNPDSIFHKLAEFEEKKVLDSIDFTEKGVTDENDTSSEYFIYWINVGDDFSFQVRYLKSLKKTQIWEDDRSYYCIKVNEVAEGQALMVGTNTEVKFFTEELRDEEWRRIKSRLSLFNYIRFL